MPWELASGQRELGHHLAPGERGPGGLDRDALLERAAAGFEAMGCRADAGAGAARGLAGRLNAQANRKRVTSVGNALQALARSGYRAHRPAATSRGEAHRFLLGPLHRQPGGGSGGGVA
jgi:hypothetical protein